MRSFQAGFLSVALGVVLHYFIALTWTSIFYVASHNLKTLRRQPVIYGLLYGGFVYLFMNLMVLPLSNVPYSPKAITLASRINGVLAVMFCVGLPISVLISRNSAAHEFHSRLKNNQVRVR
jgi:uncharacterized membrane protein